MPLGPEYRANPSFRSLGDAFFDLVDAARFPEHRLRFRNQRAAGRVGLAELTDAEWIDHFGRFHALPGNLPEPLALRYHGHQFQSYNPDLGDGRGFLFAQLLDCVDGRLLDLGTKGSGQTPWSRMGDGRLTLKGGVREVLATELLEALGVYTSRSFSLIETGEGLERGDEPSPTRSSVLVRLSHSHIRFGSFQRHAFYDDADSIERLLDYTIANYIPDLRALRDSASVSAFLTRVCERTAGLAASWYVAGFVHGVLNTDNMNVTGESFDYGPFRFLPTLDVNFVAAYFDQTGLYAFGSQPSILGWNLARLGEALRPVCDAAPLLEALQRYEPTFQRALQDKLAARLGLSPRKGAAPERLVEAVFGFLSSSQVGFERFFFDWYGGLASEPRARLSDEADRYVGPDFDALKAAFGDYDTAPTAQPEHPYFERGEPCTLLIDEVEAIWDPIADRDDWGLFERKLRQIDEMRAALAAAKAVSQT